MRTLNVITLILVFFFLISCEKNGVTPNNNKPELISIDKRQLAFPAAQGYGAYSKGGRGGKVIYVTNLNDTGEGSFRNAVQASGARTVVFAVSGIIELNSLVVISNPYLTIAGQTAIGMGITLKNSGIYIATHDVVVQHIRIRPGDSNRGHNFEDRDALTIGENSYNVIVDHVSASWAVDELMSLFYAPQFVTIQNCMLYEALSKSKHPEGEHSKALLIGDNSQKVSIHNNVFAHNNDRCPVQVKGGASCDVVNNITYNWGQYAFSFAIDYVESGVNVNLMSNYFKKGPSTTGSFFSEPANALNSQIYIVDNKGDDELLNDFNSNRETYIQEKDYLVLEPVEWQQNIDITDIEEKFNAILNYVGATLPQRDIWDHRIIQEIKNGEGKIIDSPIEVNGYVGIENKMLSESEIKAFDSDLDGMPNAYEIEMGFNENDPKDRNEDVDNDGFTNLEEYLNKL